MLAIFRRELKTYFSSPIGYIFLAVFMFFGGQAFSYMLQNNSAYIAYVFSSMSSVTIFMIPLITMRLMSEDKKLKTDQLLLTSPVSITGMVTGKFLAAAAIFIIGMLQFLIYAFIVATFVKPDWNVFFGNFFGLLLLGLALISIGLFISSLTENQVISAIGTLAIMLFITLFDSIASIMPTSIFGFQTTILGDIFTNLSITTKYTDFVNGILDISHVIFFVSVVTVFIFLTVRIIERKRWS